MRKKEKIAIIVTLAAVAVIVLAAVAFDTVQQRQRAEAKAAAEAQRAEEEAKRTYPQGETVRVSSDDKNAHAFTDLVGSMDATVLEAKIYGSFEDTGLPTGDGHFFGLRQSFGFDNSLFLVCKVDIANIDAEPLSRSKDSGAAQFLFGSVEANAAEYVYFDGSAENSSEGDRNYFELDPGSEKTLTACWQIPVNDGLSNLPESADFEFLGYIITLAPEDCR